MCECTAAEKAVLLCLDPEAFPRSEDTLTGFVDVWWVVHDGGLLLMIAHLLLRHRAWEKCRLRVHTVLQKAQDPSAVRRSLQAVLRDFRIDAEVSVVEAGDDPDMYAYTHDWTMRKEQAEMFREALMEAQGGKRRENLSEGTSSVAASPSSTPPQSGKIARSSTPPPLATRGSLDSTGSSVGDPESDPEIDAPAAWKVEDLESTDARRSSRDSRRGGSASHSLGTSPVDDGHASISSIFDLGDVATPKRPAAK